MTAQLKYRLGNTIEKKSLNIVKTNISTLGRMNRSTDTFVLEAHMRDRMNFSLSLDIFEHIYYPTLIAVFVFFVLLPLK